MNRRISIPLLLALIAAMAVLTVGRANVAQAASATKAEPAISLPVIHVNPPTQLTAIYNNEVAFCEYGGWNYAYQAFENMNDDDYSGSYANSLWTLTWNAYEYGSRSAGCNAANLAGQLINYYETLDAQTARSYFNT